MNNSTHKNSSILLRIWLSIIFVSMFWSLAWSQGLDKCAPVGWATQNGGVTGGGSATPVVVDTYDKLKAAVTSSTVAVVHVSGTITIPAGGRISIQDVNNKTIFGLPGAKIVSGDMTKDGSGIFYIKRCNNLILQNLNLVGPGAYDTDGFDLLCIDLCSNFWADHCEFHDGMDGNFDIKNASNYVSVTWCKFSYEKAPKPDGPGGADDHRYSNLIGSSDGATGDVDKLNVTFAFCWWGQGVRERMPRMRFGKLHMLNNLFNSTVSNQCIRAGYKADVLAEGNYFDNQKLPIDEYEKNYTAIRGVNNFGASDLIKNTAFKPPYTYTVALAANIPDQVMKCAGATLSGFQKCSACSGEQNAAPVVNITAPANNSFLTAPASITISANATDSDGSISKVDFYNNTTLLNTDYSSPYSYSWSNVAAGVYKITAVATDNKGATTTSQIITVTVESNQPSLYEPANKTQSVVIGMPIEPITFTWGGSATGVNVTGLPSGLSYNLNNTAKTVTISGTPTNTATYTVTTVGGTPAVSKQGTISTKNDALLTASNEVQTIAPSTAISTMKFVWSGAATNVSYTSLPSGLSAAIDVANKTLTITGTPASSGTFTVSTIGGDNMMSITAKVTISETVTLANWYPFQENPIKLSFVSFTNASLNTSFDASAYTSAECTNGAVTLTKATGILTLKFASLVSLKIRMCATGGRILTVTYGPTGTENTWTSGTYTSGGRELDLVSLIPALASDQDIVINIINSRADGGNLNITDLYAVGAAAQIQIPDVTQTIQLTSGWNLISINVHPTDSSISKLFANADVAIIKNPTQYWKKGNTELFNSLKTIVSGEGYMVYMNSAATITITGRANTTKTISQHSAGWHLIGCPFQTKELFSTHFNTSNCEIIKSADGFWQPQGSTNSIEEFVPGEAYYVLFK
ncbi:MAG: hypothetical protein IPO21_07605 [Bacteroidales bacterium]|nr:hypothetical protein [Bacteroidales bacterium]